MSVLENVEISDDYSRPGIQYELAAKADMVLAKYTSIGDECMAAGIPVVFHDYTPIMVSSAHKAFRYNDIPVFASEFDAIAHNLRQTLDSGHYLTDSECSELAKLVNDRVADGNARNRMLADLQQMLEAEQL